MSPLNLSLSDLIENVDEDLSQDTALAKITEAQARAHTLTALADQLVGHYVAIAKEEGASWTEIGDAIGVSKQAAQQRHSTQVFGRFTNLARHAVVLAQEAARSHRHDYIGTEHLLLGLLDEPKGLAAKLLGSADAVRAALDERMSPAGKRFPRGHIPFTPRGKHAIDLAIEEATGLGHDWVGTEHLLLGLLAETDGVAAQSLATLGFDLDGTRQKVADEITRMRDEE
jgi:Clp amino terminal domain, pathogenicity island component